MTVMPSDIFMHPAILQASFVTPIGKIGIYVAENVFCRLKFLLPEAELITPSSPFVVEIVRELQHYFRDPHFKFSFPLDICGTDLQRAIWQALCAIPVGTVLTYGALAQQLKTSPRVVGNACRANQFPVIIPCHRVVGATSLGGYAGEMIADGCGHCDSRSDSMLAKKRWLLRHEGADVVFYDGER